MKTFRITSLAMAVAILAGGCTTPYGQPDRTATGALLGGAIGAGTGALIGNAAGHQTAAGAAIGGVVGLLAGGLIGHQMDQDAQARLRQQAPVTMLRVEQGQPLGLADIKALATAGVSDEVIFSQIRNSHTVYRLSTADIIDMKASGVSEKVIDFMINTANIGSSASTPPGVAVSVAPPPPQQEVVVLSPGPSYVWVNGYWNWDGLRWVWVPGYWALPPYSGAVWMGGYWSGGVWIGGYWGHGGRYHGYGHGQWR